MSVFYLWSFIVYNKKNDNSKIAYLKCSGRVCDFLLFSFILFKNIITKMNNFSEFITDREIILDGDMDEQEVEEIEVEHFNLSKE